MQLNIVHPFTFYTRGDKFDLSARSEKNRANQKMLRQLVRTSLRSECEVLAHEFYSGQVAEIFGEVMFGNTPIYKMLDQYKVNWISTTDYGLPLPNDKPKGISKKDWEQLKELVISHSEMKKKVERHETYFFVGGFLELCLANCIGYVYSHTGSEERKLFYVPELCVVKNTGNLEKVLPKFQERGIFPIGYEEALEIIKQNK
ncbi:MAG: hypothetical protein AABX03_02805 [Nanoarchaeota archaeon]